MAARTPRLPAWLHRHSNDGGLYITVVSIAGSIPKGGTVRSSRAVASHCLRQANGLATAQPSGHRRWGDRMTPNPLRGSAPVGGRDRLSRTGIRQPRDPCPQQTRTMTPAPDPRAQSLSSSRDTGFYSICIRADFANDTAYESAAGIGPSQCRLPSVWS